VALLAVVLAGRWLPADLPKDATEPPRKVVSGLDLPGVLLYSLTVVALLLGLSMPGRPLGWAALGTLPIAAALFLWREQRAAEPFLDVALIARRPEVLAVFVRYALANIAYYGLLFAVPAWLQDARSVSPTTAGLLLVPMALCGALAAPLAGHRIQRTGPRAVLMGASLTLLVGSVLMTTLNDATPLAAVAVVAALVGVFNNPNTLGLQAVLYQATPPDQTATISGVFQSFRYIGSILATALLSAAFANGTDTAGVRFIALTLCAIAALMIAINATRRPEHTTNPG
jgi:predicted MFS family arabinose efflux permease